MATHTYTPYVDQEKVYRDPNGKWSLPKGTDISPAGRLIVEAEPNLEPETFELLLRYDMDRLSEEDKVLFAEKSKKEIVEKVFAASHDIGFAHLSQCIKENLKQPVAELVARYSIERRIPFLLGAIYILALMETQPLYYFENRINYGVRRIRWKPISAYVPPPYYNPPFKRPIRNRKKPYITIPTETVYEVADCPYCGSRGVLRRIGPNMKKWYGCCSNDQCELFKGLTGVKTERIAAKEWNDFAAQAAIHRKAEHTEEVNCVGSDAESVENTPLNGTDS